MTNGINPVNQPNHMIAVLGQVIREMLLDAEKQKERLNKAINCNSNLRSDELAQIHHENKQLIESIEDYLIRCKKWRSSSLSQNQRQWLDEIEANMCNLTSIGKEISSLLRSHLAFSIEPYRHVEQ